MGSSGATRPAAGAVPVARENRPTTTSTSSSTSACRIRPSAQLDAAQRQLDGLVDPAGAPTAARGTDVVRRAAPAVAVIDHTYTCNTTILGGLYELKNRAHAGVRSGIRMVEAPVRGRRKWGMGRPADGPSECARELARLDHGRSPVGDDDRRRQRRGLPVRGGGTIGVNASVCRPSSAKVALSSAGLGGGAVSTSWRRNRLHRVSSCPRPTPRDRRRGRLRYASAHGSSSRRTRPLVRRSSPSGRRRGSCSPTPRSTEPAPRGSSPPRGACGSEASSGQSRRALRAGHDPRRDTSVRCSWRLDGGSHRRSDVGVPGRLQQRRATRRDHRPVGST